MIWILKVQVYCARYFQGLPAHVHKKGMLEHLLFLIICLIYFVIGLNLSST